MKKFKVIVIIIVLLLTVIVILQNTESVETRFLFARLNLPRAFLLFLTFIFGFIGGLLAALSFVGKNEKKKHKEKVAKEK